MQLITGEIREAVLANDRARDRDLVPGVKFFDPTGAATWLIAEMDPGEPDILFGLCDLGMGFPELGSVSLSELESVKGRLGLGIERDLYFKARFPLSVYAEAAREAQAIVETQDALARAAARLGISPQSDGGRA